MLTTVTPRSRGISHKSMFNSGGTFFDDTGTAIAGSTTFASDAILGRGGS